MTKKQRKEIEALAATFTPGELVWCDGEGFVFVTAVEYCSVIVMGSDGVELSASPYQLTKA